MKHPVKVQASLAFVVFVGFFGALWLLMTVEPGQAMREALLALVGVLGAGFTQVIGFYFGSSSGSQAKDENIATRIP
jgi:hypothetical protein